MTTIQKIIRIGSSKGVTLPAKQLKALGVDVDDEVEVIVRKKNTATNATATDIAQRILEEYDTDFKNLANR